jgi:ankyrin repeat protein
MPAVRSRTVDASALGDAHYALLTMMAAAGLRGSRRTLTSDDIHLVIKRAAARRGGRLARAGLDLNALCNGNTLLHFAVRLGSVSGVRALLGTGLVDCSRCCAGGTTPFVDAVRANKPEIVAAILAHQDRTAADDNERDLLVMGGSETPLLFAVRMRWIRMTEVLLAAGAWTDVRAQGSGETALHYAAAMRDPVASVMLLEMLLSAGASASVADNRGLTPMHTAVLCDNVTCIQFLALSRRDGLGGSALWLSVVGSKLLAARTLLVCGADADGDLDPRTGRRPRPLASARTPEMAQLLLRYGAHPNAGTSLTRMSPSILCHAVSRNDVEIVRLLLAHGADPNTVEHDTPASGRDGWNALHYAAMAESFEVFVEVLARMDPECVHVSGKMSRSPLEMLRACLAVSKRLPSRIHERIDLLERIL